MTNSTDDSATLPQHGQVSEGPLLAILRIDAHKLPDFLLRYHFWQQIQGLVSSGKIINDYINLLPSFPDVGSALFYLRGVSRAEEVFVRDTADLKLESIPNCLDRRVGLGFVRILVLV